MIVEWLHTQLSKEFRQRMEDKATRQRLINRLRRQPERTRKNTSGD